MSTIAIFRFTAKELGLYYYGARYLDLRYSMWISTDPALGEYIPKAPINEETKRYNQNLPGMGGVFNHINGNLYAYAGNNPVKYTDPDGRKMGMSPALEQLMNQRNEAQRIKTAKSTCTYGTNEEVRQTLADNKRTDQFGIYAIKNGTVVQIQTMAPNKPKDDETQPAYGK